jgi:hypothetical protein
MGIYRQLAMLTGSGNCPKIAFAMFGDLYDTLSYLWSWRWPVAQGDVTAVDVERIQRGRDTTYRLAIAYEFSLGADGPYTGESFWRPAFLARRRVQSKAREFHRRQPVTVRYRPDDPSVNRLDRTVWRKSFS